MGYRPGLIEFAGMARPHKLTPAQVDAALLLYRSTDDTLADIAPTVGMSARGLRAAIIRKHGKLPAKGLPLPADEGLATGRAVIAGVMQGLGSSPDAAARLAGALESIDRARVLLAREHAVADAARDVTLAALDAEALERGC